MRRLSLLIIAGVTFAAAACGGPVDQPTKNTGNQDNLTVLGPGEKADNFRSQSAQEYYVEGTTTIELSSEYADKTEEERMQRVKELIPYKQVVIGYFLNEYLIDKSSHDSNEDYGGFKALTKNGSYEDLGIEKQEELTYSFKFVQEVGGQLDLLESLSSQAGAQRNADGSYSFEIAVGDLSTREMTQLDHGREWYRGSPWSSFSPDSVDDSKYYQQELTIRPQERSPDAWIEYGKLFEDGTANIDIFFGWDYHDAYHKKHAKSTYQWLVRNGYESPVESWDAYAENRGPLTATINADGKEVGVEVTLWWGEEGTATDPDTDAGGRKLEQAMRESFKNNEVTAFSGHSGPWYGFALANWRKTSEGDIDDSEVPELDMPSDKYQIVLAEGCDTYALGEAFWKNPAKADEETLDIITTTSFSNAGTHKAVTDFLDALIGADSNGNHRAETYGSLLEDLDNNSFWFQTMYGVHGIDDNPTTHPYANTGQVCRGCSTNADCGGQGNRCVNMEGSNVCTYECTADAGCPDGYACRETRTGNYLSASVCVPTNFTCNEEPESNDGPSIVFNEVLADPAFGEAGDANGDGSRSYKEDEFIELKNVGSEAVDISGWKIADGVTVRQMFPGSTVLEPGEYAVVFGGGDTDAFTGLPEEAKVLTAESGLYLNNSGDNLTLINHEGDAVDSVEYGSEGGRDASLVRNGDSLEIAESMTPGASN